MRYPQSIISEITATLFAYNSCQGESRNLLCDFKMHTSYLSKLLPILPLVPGSSTSKLAKRNGPILDPYCTQPGSTWQGEMAYDITQIDPSQPYHIPFTIPCRINSDLTCFRAAWESADGFVDDNGGDGFVSGDVFIAILNKGIAAGCDEGNSPGYAADSSLYYQFGEITL